MKKVAIIGGGPAGCACAYFLQNFCDVTVFDKKSPLLTLLPTGGGRCNLAHEEYDFRELVKSYPRGEKFLYSVFSKFGTAETLEMFEKMGVETYSQNNGRIFPTSNSSKDVREKFLASLKACQFKKEEVKTIPEFYDVVVLAVGGHAGYSLAKQVGHKIISPKPSLVGLRTKEDFSRLAGVKIDDVLFTHVGVSGPKIYEISSINARKEFPYTLNFDFWGDNDLQKMLNENSHKDLSNVLSEIVPKSLAKFVVGDSDIKASQVNKNLRDEVLGKLKSFEITVLGTVPDGETVTAGGVSLNEINPKTMQSKINSKIFFVGEILDIDGFCGGYNLQNCWSTSYVAAEGIKTII